jgi:hypothetical protein
MLDPQLETLAVEKWKSTSPPIMKKEQDTEHSVDSSGNRHRLFQMLFIFSVRQNSKTSPRK